MPLTQKKSLAPPHKLYAGLLSSGLFTLMPGMLRTWLWIIIVDTFLCPSSSCRADVRAVFQQMRCEWDLDVRTRENCGGKTNQPGALKRIFNRVVQNTEKRRWTDRLCFGQWTQTHN